MEAKERLNFKLDPEFESYWPKLSKEKFIILEQSILDEGLRENLVVWKEENILIDGHQRLIVLRKHNISIDNKIARLSFADRLHAKQWVHANQTGRRGDVSKFLNICHVMEFEPIYREEAKKRQKEHGKTEPGKPKTLPPTVGVSVLNKGEAVEFMAKDSGTSRHSVDRVLYIQKYDAEKFNQLKSQAQNGEDISILLEYSKIKAILDAKKSKAELNIEAVEKLKSADAVKAFSDAIQKHKPSQTVQEAAIEEVIKSEEQANESYIEDAIIRRLPKKKHKKQDGFEQMKKTIKEISDAMNLAIGKIHLLHDELREKYGDDTYFQALKAVPELEAAYAQFVIAGKTFIGGYDEKNQKKENLLKQAN